MREKTQRQIDALLANPDELIKYKPFTRGMRTDLCGKILARDKVVDCGEMITATLPKIKKKVVSQNQYLQELDPACHKVLFDENIPSITMKTKDGGYVEIEYKKMAVPFQQMIRDKHVLHLCGNPTQFTLLNTNPSEKDILNFATFKQMWNNRNMDGMRTKMVSTQMSVGNAGLLFYFDYNGQLKARLLSYEDGYILCPHNDENGDRILECVYYENDGTEYIDCYDYKYMYRFVKTFEGDSVEDGQWQQLPKEEHGFSEIPLITKRGKVAWDNVQDIIEVYEVIYNIFLVIQKRHGWGILYIKGSFKQKAQTIAGAVILNDTNPEGNGSADFKTPPSPQNMIDTLGLMEETIQKGSGTTFLLPKDVKSTGDISAQAIMLTQSRDIETALQNVIEWQNVIDKMARLAKEGFAKELVNKKINDTAITDFARMNIGAKFKAWRPQNDSEYNQMLIQLKGSGLISEETGIEKNTESSPDEKVRRMKEKEEAERLAEKEMMLKQQTQTQQEGGTENGN